jgi:hypothetical protein
LIEKAVHNSKAVNARARWSPLTRILGLSRNHLGSEYMIVNAPKEHVPGVFCCCVAGGVCSPWCIILTIWVVSPGVSMPREDVCQRVLLVAVLQSGVQLYHHLGDGAAIGVIAVRTRLPGCVPGCNCEAKGCSQNALLPGCCELAGLTCSAQRHLLL